ncbi:MAG: polysaccharide deacetylase family protein [Haloarculaceae archaeon]
METTIMNTLMYHYVRPTMDLPPYGYYHLSLESFRRQLDHLEAEYDMLSREAFFECVRGERTPPEDAAVLTFDDGLEDHHRWVLPELERRGLWGIFFVSTGPLADGRRLPVHRVHTLAGAVSADRLVDELTSLLSEAGELDDASRYEEMYSRRGTPEQVRTFKRILNQEVPYERLDGVLDRLEAAFPNAGLAVDAADYYLTDDQVTDLVDAGMVVGAHTVSHRILSRLSPADQRVEIADSKAYLESVIGEPVRVLGYPYGTAETYTGETLAIAADQGFEAAFTTEGRATTAESFDERPFRLPRFDCTEFPHGESREGLPRTGSGPEAEFEAEVLD